MKVALVGNQNSGKTSLFNKLTGSNQKVGNWPGVTIERKIGIIKDTDFELIDLPGIYSLSPYTKEEEVSRKYVINENPDLIINVIDVTSIERSLYLTTQILELNINTIIVLNMEDLLLKKGLKVNVQELSKILGVTVLSISALKNIGIDELIKCVKDQSYLKIHKIKIYDDQIEEAISRIEKEFENELTHPRFEAIKIIENDPMYFQYKDRTKNKELLNSIENDQRTDFEEIIASSRYNYIDKIKQRFIEKTKKEDTITDKLDKIFLNKYFAIPIFIIIMTLVYLLSVGTVGSLTVDLVDGLVGSFSNLIYNWLTSINTSPWLVSLVCDGIIQGVGAMLNFVPQLMIMFICISVLETSGYMSRIAFFLDKVFKKFGLSGKSLIPFIVGSGCSVPGIMTTRTIEDESEKKMTIMLTPFIPCSAKLPIIIVFSSYFFKNNTGLIAASLYFFAIIVILLSAIVMKKFVYKANSSAFITELPEYKAPSIKYVSRDVFDKVIAFIKRAGTIILLASIVVWLLLSFTWDFKYTKSEAVEIDNINLEQISNLNGIEDYEDIEIIQENGIIKASFINEEQHSPYFEIMKVDNIHLSHIDKRKELTVFEEEGKLYYTYSYGIDSSILASLGKGLSYLFYPMLGELNWAATVSAIQGLVAKEQVIGSMAVISGLSEDSENSDLIFSSSGPFANFTQASAYAFMVFNLFSAPCFGAIGAMRRELGSKKSMFKAIGFQTVVAFILSYLVFGFGTLIGVIF